MVGPEGHCKTRSANTDHQEAGTEWYLGITLDKIEDWMAGRHILDAIRKLGCLTVGIVQDYCLDKPTIPLESVYLQSIIFIR
jgi:hypothetical protein